MDDIWGVGRQYAVKLHHLGIDNGWQLRNMPEEWGRKNMGGRSGRTTDQGAAGYPLYPMKDPLEIKKMIATTRMFGKPAFELNDIKEAVATYTSRAAEKLRRQHCAARSIQVFVVTNGNGMKNMNTTRNQDTNTPTFPKATSDTSGIDPLCYAPGGKTISARDKIFKSRCDPRGIGPGQFHSVKSFPERSKSTTSDYLMEAVDNINFSHRDDIVKYVASGLKRNWKMRQELRSKRFTTRWDELYEIK